MWDSRDKAIVYFATALIWTFNLIQMALYY